MWRIYLLFSLLLTIYIGLVILAYGIKTTVRIDVNNLSLCVKIFIFDWIEVFCFKIFVSEQQFYYQINKKDIKLSSANKKIEEQVKKANKEAEALSQALGQIGQTIYKRDLNSAIYITDNVINFLYGKDGIVYVIYAYGNSSSTSEMDIIKL